MQNSKILFVILLASSFFLTACTKSQTEVINQDNQQQEAMENSGENMDNNGDVPDNNANLKLITLEEVAQHNNADDCWTVIHGEVFDITKAIGRHPGGEAILQGCGIDATELFETRPMGSGTPHSEMARENLDNFYLGDLAR